MGVSLCGSHKQPISLQRQGSKLGKVNYAWYGFGLAAVFLAGRRHRECSAVVRRASWIQYDRSRAWDARKRSSHYPFSQSIELCDHVWFACLTIQIYSSKEDAENWFAQCGLKIGDDLDLRTVWGLSRMRFVFSVVLTGFPVLTLYKVWYWNKASFDCCKIPYRNSNTFPKARNKSCIPEE